MRYGTPKEMLLLQRSAQKEEGLLALQAIAQARVLAKVGD
ncbi:unnamed protein product [marine sediment metagenome]|uniref:Uncharacterized protein n=1 Tax=marine sediment metagenome TaxID=412755 RepID=X1UDT9_9ZZZZ